MGKSSKKVKNDRINTIRKQYDAFLEEDKKRRERNEYILGKLDKMRSSTALVPMPALHRHNELNPAEIYMSPNSQRAKLDMDDRSLSHLERPTVNLGMLNKHIDEANILKEICKKYILIPKRRTTFENDYIYSKDSVDDDWKSKYNILDDLKKLEKEEEPGPVFHQNNDNNVLNKTLQLSKNSNISDKLPTIQGDDPSHFDEPTSDKNNEIIKSNKLVDNKDNVIEKVSIPEINSQDSDVNKIPLQIASISPNQVISSDQTQYYYNAAQEPVINPHEETPAEEEKYNSESTEKDQNLPQSFNNNLKVREVRNIQDSTDYQETKYQPDYRTSIAETKKLLTENIKSDMNDLVSEHVTSDMHPQDSSATGNQEVANEIQNLTSTERVELYDDMDNNPEGEIKSNESNFDPNPNELTQNTIPVELENTEHIDHVESEINAFETEQKEMFYSEEPTPDTYAYNQGDSNAGEYTEGYGQNDQYGYYEGIQQEQAYTTHINEHEESTERYDPHYTEQYEESYAIQQPDNTVNYETTTEYEQPHFQNENPAFENVNNYEHQQENTNLYQHSNVTVENEGQENNLHPQDNEMYDQNLYSVQPETQEHIEQQLITEEGYTENTQISTVEAFQKVSEGEVENITDVITTEEEPIADPKIA